MTNSRAQIIATLGPTSEKRDVLKAMIDHQLDVIRLNFSWGNLSERVEQINLIRDLGKDCGRHIPIIIDLPGPRVQGKDGHTYDREAVTSLTENDKEFIRFAVKHNVEYVAVSFVAGPEDIENCRKIITNASGNQKIIAKIERAVAIESLEQIIASVDAIMVARGDLGNEVPLEQIVNNHPIISIEDGLGEDDWQGFSDLRDRLGDKISIVGDDLTVTNVGRIMTAEEKQAINSVLIKLNQIGTLTETMSAVLMTKKQGWAPFVSHRSGETTDTFIADLAVGLSCDYIKSGSLVRGERVSKYNRLMDIENIINNK